MILIVDDEDDDKDDDDPPWVLVVTLALVPVLPLALGLVRAGGGEGGVANMAITWQAVTRVEEGPKTVEAVEYTSW